ncbi:MAG: retroviral-like aspartic protease family protein [Saprospiraceae bacterium]
MRWMVFFFLFIGFSVFGQRSIAFLDTPNHKVVSISSNIPENSQAIPMEIVRGMIYLEAEMNGEKGQFILDTGAPMLLVNQKELKQKQANALSFGEGISVTETEISSFNLANIHRKNLPALALDISHLEKASGKKIMGLIGYNVLEQYELLLDFDNNLLYLINVKSTKLPSLHNPVASISFNLDDHLPVIQAKIGGQILRLGIDTGAASNLLDEKVLAGLTDQEIDFLPNEEIQGLDQKVKEVKAAVLHQVDVNGHNIDNAKFLFTDLSFLREKTGHQLDGLLGSPFFSSATFSINYPKKKINIWSTPQPN